MCLRIADYGCNRPRSHKGFGSPCSKAIGAKRWVSACTCLRPQEESAKAECLPIPFRASHLLKVLL